MRGTFQELLRHVVICGFYKGEGMPCASTWPRATTLPGHAACLCDRPQHHHRVHLCFNGRKEKGGKESVAKASIKAKPAYFVGQ